MGNNNVSKNGNDESVHNNQAENVRSLRLEQARWRVGQ